MDGVSRASRVLARDSRTLAAFSFTEFKHRCILFILKNHVQVLPPSRPDGLTSTPFTCVVHGADTPQTRCVILHRGVNSGLARAGLYSSPISSPLPGPYQPGPDTPNLVTRSRKRAVRRARKEASTQPGAKAGTVVVAWVRVSECVRACVFECVRECAHIVVVVAAKEDVGVVLPAVDAYATDKAQGRRPFASGDRYHGEKLGGTKLIT